MKTESRVHNFRDLTGMHFDRWTVLEESTQRASDGCIKWLCLCRCGTTKRVGSHALLSGHSRSCGCLSVERSKRANLRHGGKGTRLYRIWSGMKNRCCNVNSKDYANYGGRGIQVCAEWLMSFRAFLVDMGDPPFDGATLERKNIDGNYDPHNCCWATYKEQANNRRSSLLVTLRGRTQTASQWDDELGFCRGTVARRVSRGRPIDSPVNKNLARTQKKSPVREEVANVDTSGSSGAIEDSPSVGPH